MSGQIDKKEHEFYVKKRREMRVSGVIDIDSFDECGTVLQTTDGVMTVEGEALKIGELDTERGIVTVSGKINAIYYINDEKKEKQGLLSRIFK